MLFGIEFKISENFKFFTSQPDHSFLWYQNLALRRDLCQILTRCKKHTYQILTRSKCLKVQFDVSQFSLTKTSPSDFFSIRNLKRCVNLSSNLVCCEMFRFSFSTRKNLIKICYINTFYIQNLTHFKLFVSKADTLKGVEFKISDMS